MDYRLIAVGSNILVASSLLAMYSFLIGDGRLMGIAFSSIVLSSVMMALGYESSPQENRFRDEFLLDLEAALSVILEDLDLLNSKPRVLWREDGTLMMVYSKTSVDRAAPGVNFANGSPYYAFPLNNLKVDVPDLTALPPEQAGLTVSRILREATKSNDADVVSQGKSLRVALYGVSEDMIATANYPVNPIVAGVLAVLSMGYRSNTWLIDYKRTGNDIYITVEVENLAE